MSTDEPDQAIRQIPQATVEHARAFASRCATYDELKTRPPLLEQNPYQLYRRCGERLNGTEHAVYGMVRQARRLNFAGAYVSHHELGELVGRHERSVRRALRALVRLELLRAVPLYGDGGAASSAGYDRSRLRNAYALGRKGKEPRVLPGLGGAPPPRRAPRICDNSSDKVAALSEGRTEVFQTSVSPSCLPSSATTAPEPRGEVSPSATRSATPSPSMPAAPAERLRNEKSKVRTDGSRATLGELAEFRARTRQNARDAHAAAEAGDGAGWARALAEAL